jgi:hypothetical protein
MIKMKNAPVFISFLFLFAISCKGKNKTETNRPVDRQGPQVADSQSVNPYSALDISPMDMSYYPDDYPKLKMAHTVNSPPVVRVIYSRPHRQGRKIFGALLPYGERWRLGANESTEIQFYRDVTIEGKKIKAGRYLLYAIPNADKWSVMLNSDIDTWGFKIDSTKDIAKFDAGIKKPPVNFEYFTIIFQKNPKGADLVMAWDDVEARLPIEFDEIKSK